MKSTPHFLRVFSVLAGALFLFNFNACKKDDTPPADSCCTAKPPELQWLLTNVQYSYFYGAGFVIITRHTFEYNSFNKPIVHKEITDLITPSRPPSRIDSFYYNNKQQLIRINSEEPGALTANAYKEMFSYDASDRKKYSLKYSFSITTNQYELSDSTDYQYVDSTIWKITYHFVTATQDSAFFTYNQQKNIVKFKVDRYPVQELESYDNRSAPASYAGIDGFELDPYIYSGWSVECMLLMQSPVFSKNNFMRRLSVDEDVDYSVTYSAVDSIPSEIVSGLSYPGPEFRQYYVYVPAN